MEAADKQLIIPESPSTQLLSEDRIVVHEEDMLLQGGNQTNPHLSQSGVFSIPQEESPGCCSSKCVFGRDDVSYRVLLVPVLHPILHVLLLPLLRQEADERQAA